MKKLIVLFGFFLVTWNEYRLQYHDCPNERATLGGGCYTVDLSTHSIKLATQRDVDLLVGTKGKSVRELFGYSSDSQPIYVYKYQEGAGGIISPNAFNIRVSSEQEK